VPWVVASCWCLLWGWRLAVRAWVHYAVCCGVHWRSAVTVTVVPGASVGEGHHHGGVTEWTSSGRADKREGT